MQSVQYVGIFKRFASHFIDVIVLGIINSILFVLGQSSELTLKFFVGNFLLSTLISWSYYALFESSPARATLGKMALGIAVNDKLGNQISLSQATIRVFSKFFYMLIISVAFIIGSIAQSQGDKSSLWALSGLLFIAGFLIFSIGYLMAAFTPQKQALHDIIARTFIVEFEDESSKFPQKVLLQLAALALVSRLIFQLVPATPTPWLASGATNPSTTEETSPSSTTEASPSSTTEETSPSSTTEASPSSTTEGVYNICRDRVVIGSDRNLQNLDGEWEIQFVSKNIKHKVSISIKDDSGKTTTQFFDTSVNKSVTIEQDIRLGTSDRGTWILGFNPINAETKEDLQKIYSADNFFLEISPSGEQGGYNCDDRGNKSPMSMQKLADK